MFPAYLFMLVWDHFFIVFGVWGVHADYTLGINLWEVPLEEHLFFWCVPFAAVFVYEALNYFVKQDPVGTRSLSITGLLAFGLPIVIYLFFGKLYTAFTALCLLFLLIQHLFVFRSHRRYLGRFYLAFCVCLIPFFAINGLLTSLPVVWYNPRETCGISLGSVPLEDLFLGMFHLLLVITLYERLKKHKAPTLQQPKNPGKE